MAQQNLTEPIGVVQPARLLSFPQVPPRPDSTDSSYEDSCEALERAVASVSFLLDWSSGLGNHPLDGATIVGFAKILDHCVQDLTRLRKLHSRIMIELGEKP